MFALPAHDRDREIGKARSRHARVESLQLVDHGTPASTRIYTVTEDGMTLTETKAFFGKDGSPILQTTTFTRVP